MNLLETTINLEKRTYCILNKNAIRLNKNFSHIITDVVNKIIKKYQIKDNITTGRCIQYQSRGKTFSKIHFRATFEVYEACIDIRKFFKKSLSMIINDGILEFLDESLKQNSQSYNYQIDNNTIIYSITASSSNQVTIIIEIKGKKPPE